MWPNVEFRATSHRMRLVRYPFAPYIYEIPTGCTLGVRPALVSLMNCRKRRKFMATAVTATTLLLVFGLRLVGRAESRTSAKAGDTTQEKIARATSAGPDNVSE